MGEKAEALLEEVRVKYGQAGGLDKTALFVAEFLSTAWEQELKSPSLERLCKSILSFAKDPRAASLPKRPGKASKKQPAAS